MKILVTGGDGQLGNALRKFAGDYQDHVFSFIDIHDLDLTDSTRMDTYLTEYNPNVLINCAAYTAVDKAESEPERAMAVNAMVPGEMAKICANTGIRLVHISTDYVFDGKSFIPYKENDPVNPVSVYAKSKMEGETRILQENVRGIIIRTSWLYSEYGQNFVKTILKKGKELGKLRVVYDQVGSPTYAGDLAKAILDILPEVAATNSMEIYHYADEGVISWFDFAHAIIEISGIQCVLDPIESKDFSASATRPPYSVFNKARFKKRFGITIPYWRTSLEECIGNMPEFMNMNKQ
jgi:dTDP-4-dehydrorhamnose reductase